jgi:mannose-6-phosphate isomerase
VRREILTECEHFNVERVTVKAGARFESALNGDTFEVWGLLWGTGTIRAAESQRTLEAVKFVLLPATMGGFEVQAATDLVALRTCLP